MRPGMRIAIGAAMAAATAVGAAAAGQVRPGELTKAEVWVQNRDSEAIPVNVRQLHSDTPLRVIVANGDAGTPVPVRTARPTWEYRTIAIKTADDPARALFNVGNEGWEVTGVAWPAADGTLLLLKRTR